MNTDQIYSQLQILSCDLCAVYSVATVLDVFIKRNPIRGFVLFCRISGVSNAAT